MKELIVLFLFVPLISFGQNERLKAKTLFFEAVDSYRSENYQDAIKKGKLSNSLNPSERAFQIIASSMFLLRDFKASIENLNSAIELNPSPQNYADRGDSKVGIRDLEGALLDFNAAINGASKTNPDIAEYYASRGFVYSKLKKYSQALNDYSEAININPNESSYFFNRGEMKLFLRDLKGCCSDWRRAASQGNAKANKWVKETCKKY